MNQFELNRIASKLRKLDLDEAFVEAYLEKLRRNNESFATASKLIDQWEKRVRVNSCSKHSLVA